MLFSLGFLLKFGDPKEKDLYWWFEGKGEMQLKFPRNIMGPSKFNATFDTSFTLFLGEEWGLKKHGICVWLLGLISYINRTSCFGQLVFENFSKLVFCIICLCCKRILQLVLVTQHLERLGKRDSDFLCVCNI